MILQDVFNGLIYISRFRKELVWVALIEMSLLWMPSGARLNSVNQGILYSLQVQAWYPSNIHFLSQSLLGFLEYLLL